MTKEEEQMFEKNTKQVNQMIARMYMIGSGVIFVLVFFSVAGIFEFGKTYTGIILIAGLITAISPSILMHYASDRFMKYYMLIMAAVFIGVLGTNNHIGVYITYALIPVASCLYFDPKFVLRMSVFSYIIMLVSVYIGSAYKYEVVYQGRVREYIFIAYALGFTIEFLLVCAVLYEIVKRAKKMMEERYSAEEQNKMKSQFLSNMSHEIRTPMNAIIGLSEVALQKDMPEAVRKDISIIHSSSKGLLEIINDILDISKIEAGKLSIMAEEYTTQSLIEDMKAIINARNMDEKLPIYYHVQEDMPAVLEGDAVRIKQVMLNYASNAIKYTSSGKIDIYVRCEKRDDTQVNLIYEVKDTGQGIRKEDMPKLFTMYTQLNREQNYGKEGTGIGLALSKSIMERMHGNVSVESEYGKGSTFSFSVPQKVIAEMLAVKKEPEQDITATEPENFKVKDVHILLVDDNEINREVVKAMLESMEIDIDEAENGKEAVDKAKEKIYDLIFMDSHMPVMNGEEATKVIRASEEGKNQNTPIIAITADAIAGVRERMLSVGMNDYIVKPIEMQVLMDRLRKYLPKEKRG